MASETSWSVRGVDPRIRALAKALAEQSGMSVGEWLNQAILNSDLPAPDAPEAQREWAPNRPEPTYIPSEARAEEVLPPHDVLKSRAPGSRRGGDAVAAAPASPEPAAAGEDGEVDVAGRLDRADRQIVQLGSRIWAVLDDVRMEQARLMERVRRLEQLNAQSEPAEAADEAAGETVLAAPAIPAPAASAFGRAASVAASAPAAASNPIPSAAGEAEPAAELPAQVQAEAPAKRAAHLAVERGRAAAQAAAMAAEQERARRRGLGALLLGERRPARAAGHSLSVALLTSAAAITIGSGAFGYALVADHPGHHAHLLASKPAVIAPLIQAPAAAPAPQPLNLQPVAYSLESVTPLPASAPEAGMPPAASAPMIGPAVAPASFAPPPPPSPPAADSFAAAQPAPADLYQAAVQGLQAKDPSALRTLRQAAATGYAPAEFHLATLYEGGQDGVKKDLGQARAWTQKAADGGEPRAMHNLGLYEFEGVGGPPDAAAAVDWFRRAADLGVVESQYNLGRLYEAGLGVPRNTAEAYKWYLTAARAGDAEAQAAADKLRSQLSLDARVIAERAAASADQTQSAAQTRAAPGAEVALSTTDPDVTAAQQALSRLGYYQGPADGASSPALRLAIAAYQRDQGLPATGELDGPLNDRFAAVARGGA